MHAVRQRGSADIVSQKQHEHAFPGNRNRRVRRLRDSAVSAAAGRRVPAQVPMWTILKMNRAAITQITGLTSRARPVVSFRAA